MKKKPEHSKSAQLLVEDFTLGLYRHKHSLITLQSRNNAWNIYTCIF